jgi:hypothetical protein
VGLMVPSNDIGFQRSSRALALSSCSSSAFISTRRVFLGEVKLALLFEARAGISLTQGLEGGPVLGQLLRETALRGNGGGPVGLLVLRV